MINKITVEDLEKVFLDQNMICKHTGVSIQSITQWKKQGFIPMRIATYLCVILNHKGLSFISAEDVDWLNYNNNKKDN